MLGGERPMTSTSLRLAGRTASPAPGTAGAEIAMIGNIVKPVITVAGVMPLTRTVGPSRPGKFPSRAAAFRSSQRLAKCVTNEVSGINKFAVLLETLRRRVPLCSVFGFENLRGKGTVNYRARFGNPTYCARCGHLHSDITQRRRLDRTGQNAPARSVRSELAEQTISSASANHSNVRNAASGEALQMAQQQPVLQSQAFQNRSRIRAGSIGCRLIPFGAELVDGPDHIVRIQEGNVIRIYQPVERRRPPGRIHQFRVI